MIKILKTKSYDEIGAMAGDIIMKQIVEKPDSVLGLATGETPIGIYDYLEKKGKENKLLFSDLKTVNLDEYLGIAGEEKQSYQCYMKVHFWDKLGIKKENRIIPNGMCEDGEQECKKYEEAIRRFGGIDLQLLGVGENGHIGFNEPGDVFICDTHIVSLAETTRAANSRFFSSEEGVPKMAVTMGIRTIMQARKILLAVSGGKKACALKSLLNGKITPQIPVTALLLHRDVTIVADERALDGIAPGVY